MGHCVVLLSIVFFFHSKIKSVGGYLRYFCDELEAPSISLSWWFKGE